MIEADTRNAVYLLHREGMSEREIARRLHLSRNTVKVIVAQRGVLPLVARPKQPLNEELLRSLYAECEGFAQRVHEKLIEEQGTQVSYPTLTRRLRELGISNPSSARCDRVADEPGAEMQHDTTVYHREVGGRRIKLIASMLYLRYSKRRYLKFYRVFNRFRMKCFLHEALMHWGYAAAVCVIDNTNLARLRGTGKHALIVPEMESFARARGYRFICHELKHANRKAGEERSFWTVETNFLPGRTFASMEDLNRQAFEWSTVRMENRLQGKANLIPAVAFEHERAYLCGLSPHLPAPYRVHERGTDQYGYTAFAGNYYWVPGTRRDALRVLEYDDRIKLCKGGECVAEYLLPADGVRNERHSPPGEPQPRHQPRNRRNSTDIEEQRLRAIGGPVGAYLDFAIKSMGLKRHGFLRNLFALSRKMTAGLFVRSIERAHKYTITDVATIQRISALLMNNDAQSAPQAEIDETYQQRDSYQQGRLTDIPDLSVYNDDETTE
jgi:transposase